MPRQPNVLIRASAGTGKTFQLSNRYLALLLGGESPDAILATTFTRKAAGEILERVVRRLADAAASEKESTALGKFVGVAGLAPARCKETLANLVRHLHRVRIGTLDSVFAQIGRSFALELGLSPDWQIVEETHDRRLRAVAIDAVLREEELSDLLTLLNLLAKGETKRGVASLIADTVDQLYGLFLDSDRDAWHSLARPPQLSAPDLAAAIELLRAMPIPEKLADKRDIDCANAAAGDWNALLGKGLGAKVADGSNVFNRKPLPDDVVAAYKPLVGHAQGVLVGRIVMQTEATFALLEKFDAQYRRLKSQQGVLRFDDVARSIARAERIGPIARLAHRLDAPVDHLLLDEFQDTALVQWQVLRPFARRTASAAKGSFFCVGDGKQAIYGWRGGVAEIFDAVEREVEKVETQILSQSYRSAPAVIETVNKVFSNLTKHSNLENRLAPIQAWSDRFPPHTTALGGAPGYACLETATRPEVPGDDQKTATLKFAARRVKELAAAAPGATIGILTHTNQAVARLIFELRGLGLSASEEGGNPLTDSAAVLAVLSLLKLADHPGDRVARFHVANSPLGVSVGMVDAADARQAATIAQAVRRRLLRVGYGEAIEGWIAPLIPACNARELRRLEQLVDLAYAFAPTATLRTDDFRNIVDSTPQGDATPDPIRVMTLHQAKGLEFDIVVLPELEGALGGMDPQYVVERPTPTEPVTRICRYAAKETRQFLPDTVKAMFEASLAGRIAGDLCLLYVALTRAAHALHMIVAPSAENERNLPKKTSALLRAALAGTDPIAPSTVLYETGDRAWYRDPLVADEFAKRLISPTAALEPVRALLAPATASAVRGRAQSSPSRLAGGKRRSMADAFNPDRNGATQRGTVIHAWFEQVHWLDDGPPDAKVLRRVAARLEASRLDIDELLAEFHGLLERTAVRRALIQKEYLAAGLPDSLQKLLPTRREECALEVYRERRMLVPDREFLLAGAIDRLVVWRHGGRPIAADVIDFKTDRCPPGDAGKLAALREKYEPQLAAYRRAVSRMTGLPVEQITARLLVVEADALVEA